MPARRWADRIRGRKFLGGVLVVDAILDGVGGFQMLTDTGAAYTIIRPEVATALEINTRPAIGEVRFASAHTSDVAPLVRLQSVQVGSSVVRGVNAMVWSLPEQLRIDGVLGVDFLSCFRACFEFGTGVLVLGRARRGEGKGDECAFSVPH